MTTKADTAEPQVVAITGGARGIGLATATALSCRGARVAIGDLDAGAAQLAAQRIGGGALGLALDVTKRASFEAFLDQVEEELGELDVLINNAGIQHVGRFADERATQPPLHSSRSTLAG
jgi:NAD(P)-dependent dehydrogenase (short-subunit alcohol dehydrogenase family)